MATNSYSSTDKNYNPSSQDSYAIGYSKGETSPPLYSKSDNDDPLSEWALVRFFNAMFLAADEHREPRKLIWDQCWQVYNNEFDFTERAWWQHKVPIPKVNTTVDKAVAIFRKTLLKINPFYGIQAESKLGRVKGRYTMLLTDYHFDQSDIIEEMVKAFKVGLITSVAALKIWWMETRDFKPEILVKEIEEPTYEFGVQTGSQTTEQRTAQLKESYRGKLGISTVSPYNLWVVPGTRFRGIIERDEATLNEVEALADKGIYEKEAVDRLREKLCSATTISNDTTPNQTLEGRPTYNEYLRPVDLWHFWGDIYDTNGKLVKCDASFTLANKEILLRKARSNPFYHKMPPYIIGTPYLVPFSTYNRGMVENVMEIAKSITNLTNLIADGALYDAMKAFAIDIDQLDDPNEARQGLYPGKTFLRKSGSAATPNESLVQTVDVGRVPQEAMNTIALFEKYLQEGSYVNEWVGGTGSKTGRTLGEVNIKTQSALEGLDESARNLEVTVIEPAVSMVTQVIYQFHEDYALERLMDNYPQISMMLQSMSPVERYATMVGGYTFKVRGLSILLDKAQRIGELKEILQLLSYLPGFIERLNPDATLEEVLMPLGWDPSKLLINPTASAVSTQLPGGQAQPQMPPPTQMPQMNPMQQRNADEGARYGGRINNPNSRPAGGNGQPQQQPQNGAGGGGVGMGAGNPNSNGLSQQALQALIFQTLRNNARGLLQ